MSNFGLVKKRKSENLIELGLEQNRYAIQKHTNQNKFSPSGVVNSGQLNTVDMPSVLFIHESRQLTYIELTLTNIIVIATENVTLSLPDLGTVPASLRANSLMILGTYDAMIDVPSTPCAFSVKKGGCLTCVFFNGLYYFSAPFHN